MSIKYKESSASGSTWFRCSGIQVSNPFGGTPSINLQEEQVVVVDGVKPVVVSTRNLFLEFNPIANIALRDPITDALTGKSITHGDVYAILYSLYRQESEVI